MQLAMQSHVDITSGVMQEQAIGFEANAIAFYAQISGLAKDKIGYPIREICTNAWDAARGRFEVHLPTALKPMFRVRDYGTGMSHDDMMGRFARMYASDKRGQNDAVGGWGLGRFSPFAYLIGANGSGAFMVTAIHDGMARNYVLSLAESGQPMIRFMGERPTEAESGLDVSFAVERRDIDTFRSRATEILWSFHPRPTILPAIDFDEPKILAQGDGWTLYRRGTVPFSCPQVRMGCVAYAIDLYQLDSDDFVFNRDDAVMFDVPIGSLSPTLSREALAYDDRTKATIGEAMRMARASIEARVRTIVGEQPSFFAACEAFATQTDSFDLTLRANLRNLATWRGRRIPNRLSTLHGRLMHLPQGWANIDGFKGGTVDTSEIKAATHLIVQHAFANSVEKLAGLGIQGESAVWVRCRKADVALVLADLGDPDTVLALDDIKGEFSKRPKTALRKRRLLRCAGNHRLDHGTEYVDMAAGGFYASGSLRKRDTVHIGGNVNDIYRSTLRDVISTAIRIGVLEAGTTIVLRNDGEDLGGHWRPFGEVLVEALRTKVDPTAIDRSTEPSRDSMPPGLREFVGRRNLFGSNTPASFVSLASDIQAELDQLGRFRNRVRTESDDAVDALRSLGITVQQAAAERTVFDELQQRLYRINSLYPLFEVIASLSSWSNRRDHLRKLFDLYEKANVEHADDVNQTLGFAA